MSSNVNDILGAISAASEALAREPSLRSQIDNLHRDLGLSQQHNQGLEQNIVGYKSTIDQLNDKVRSLEVERDHAQFRTLELEEAHTLLANSLRKIGMDIGNAVLVVDPPKPVPPVEEPVAEQVPASPPSTPYPESPVASVPHADNVPPTADPTGFSGLTETDGKPSGKYEGLTWSQARDKYGVDGVTYSRAEWLDNGGTGEGFHS